MKKRFITMLIASSMLLTGTAALAEGQQTEPETDNVQDSIYLQIGNTNMDIGGEITEITAPYVTGEGVTLVPLRVISEAFGAEVIWSDADKSVTVTYNDLILLLTAGSKAAIVNDHAEELLAAPEIKDGTMMVPLRFIAEALGAKVSYDEESRGILIMFAELVESELLHGMHDKAYIGNSYYGWSMMTPKNMTLEYSDEDYIEFSDDHGNSISIMAERHKLPVDANELYVDMLTGGYGILTGTSKNEDGSGTVIMQTERNEGGRRVFTKMIVNGSDVMSVSLSGSFSDEDEADKAYDELLELAESFSFSQPGDMYDFSEIKGGVREYENETMKISFSVPDNYQEGFSEEGENVITFYSDEGTNGFITEIYSKSADMNKEIYAQKEHDIYCDVINPSLSVGDITDAEINGIPALAFYTSGKLNGTEYILSNYYFEIGQYVYNAAICTSDEDVRDMILSSFKAEELDYKETGDILCSRYYLVPFEFTDSGYSFQIPKYWKNEYGFMFTDTRTGSMIMGSKLSSVDKKDIDELIETIESEDVEVIEPLSKISGTDDYSALYRITEDDVPGYITIRTKTVGKDTYVFTLLSSDLYFGGAVTDEFDSMINSIKKIPK